VKTSRIMGLVIILVVFVSLAAIWFYPSIQEFMVSNAMWNGIKKFSTEFNVQNIDSIVTLPDSPQTDVLIAIPYTQYNAGELIQMKQFVENGGKLIMLDDFGYGNSFLVYAGIPARFNNILLLDPLFNYKNEYFPRITDFTADIANNGIKVVGFNHPASLSGVSQSQAMAWSSNMSFLDTNQNGNWDSGEPKGPFAVAASYSLGEGTIDLVSDPSLIMNSAAGSNNNNAFIQYLINSNRTPVNVLLDRAHLTKSPLDTSKIKLEKVRGIMSDPYTVLGIIALVFVIITWYMYQRGRLIGRN
jgi:hypothetical protein